MQLLRRYRREGAILGVILLTAIALAFFSATRNNPAAPSQTLGEIMGQGNRTAPVAPASSSLTDSQIATYQQKSRTSPNDPQAFSNLGLAYLQKARETGDPTYYTKAEGVFNKSLELDPSNADAMGGLGSLELSRHQFAKALEWGQKAHNLRPQTAYHVGVMADALVELGRYDEALETIQQMVDLRPDVSSYARVSYIRELMGQYDGAIEAMKEAVIAGGPATENVAWVTYQLGMLYFNKNDLTQAEASFQQSLSLEPNYVYALSGIASVKAAQGDTATAIKIMTDVSQRFPLQQFIIQLGDLYTVSGKPAEANRQYDLVRAIQKLYQQNGVDTDLEMALFDADHDYNLPQAVQEARQVVVQRKSVKAYDALAWTLYKSGDYKGAEEASRQALRLGTLDSLYFYHAGMIASKLGQTTEARDYLNKALSQNPNFSLLYAPQAAQTLASLGGPVAAR
ncbi:MAG TPA: tetratricopeptide repeat protein [Chloroflexia bacterium]|nr:tetratricopeptide repeat protein [Chloroflexia bacterium]